VVTAWRITKRKHLRTAFSGEGAQEFGGRWNHPGVKIVYTAESRSLAALELLVHLDSAELLGRYVVFRVGIDETLIDYVDVATLPKNWRKDPPPEKVQAIGDAWIGDGRFVVLQVPSAVAPGESNFLLNPRHPDFSKLRIGAPSPFRFDPRLTGGS
jgi:RES domain-containing protein